MRSTLDLAPEETTAETNASLADPPPSTSRVVDPPLNLCDLPDESRNLDYTLFHTLYTIIKGSYLTLIADLQGDNARYSLAIIALWQHDQLSANNRKLTAMAQMESLSFSGDGGAARRRGRNHPRNASNREFGPRDLLGCPF